MSSHHSGESVRLTPEQSCFKCVQSDSWAAFIIGPRRRTAGSRIEREWVALTGRTVQDGDQTKLLCPSHCQMHLDDMVSFENSLKQKDHEPDAGAYWSNTARRLILTCAQSNGEGYDELFGHLMEKHKHRPSSGEEESDEKIREGIRDMYDGIKRFSTETEAVRNAPATPVLGLRRDNWDRRAAFLPEDLTKCVKCTSHQQEGMPVGDWIPTSGRENVTTLTEGTGDFCQLHLDQIRTSETCKWGEDDPSFDHLYTLSVLENIQEMQQQGKECADAMTELYQLQTAGWSAQEVAEAAQSQTESELSYKDKHDAMVQRLWTLSSAHRSYARAPVCRIEGLKEPI